MKNHPKNSSPLDSIRLMSLLVFIFIEWKERKMCSKVSLGMLECRRSLFAFHTLSRSPTNDSLDRMRSRLLTEEGSTCACCYTMWKQHFIDFYLWKFTDDFRCCCLRINIYTALRLRQLFYSLRWPKKKCFKIGTLKTASSVNIKSRIYMSTIYIFSKWGASGSCVMFFF